MLEPKNGHLIFHAPPTGQLAIIPRSTVPQLLAGILDRIYAAVISPKLELLRQAELRASTYGELNFTFISNLISSLKVGPNSVVIDLGSGAGNILIQVAAEAGCSIFGVEYDHHRVAAGIEFIQKAREAATQRGIPCGEITLVEGDMFHSETLRALIGKATHVFCSNLLFEEKGLSPHFPKP